MAALLVVTAVETTGAGVNDCRDMGWTKTKPLKSLEPRIDRIPAPEYPQSAIDFVLRPLTLAADMPDGQFNTTTVAVYEGDSAVYAIGTGFVLDFQTMPLGTPEFEIQNGRVEIIVNDTRASVLGPAAFDETDADQLAAEVVLQFYQHGDEIEYVIGMHDPMLSVADDDANLLDMVYEPFHAIADDGTQYEVRHRFAGSSGDVTGDPILGIDPRDDLCLQVRNTEKGWTVPVSIDRLVSLFEDGKLHAVIPVVECGCR